MPRIPRYVIAVVLAQVINLVAVTILLPADGMHHQMPLEIILIPFCVAVVLAATYSRFPAALSTSIILATESLFLCIVAALPRLVGSLIWLSGPWQPLAFLGFSVYAVSILAAELRPESAYASVQPPSAVAASALVICLFAWYADVPPESWVNHWIPRLTVTLTPPILTIVVPRFLPDFGSSWIYSVVQPAVIVFCGWLVAYAIDALHIHYLWEFLLGIAVPAGFAAALLWRFKSQKRSSILNQLV